MDQMPIISDKLLNVTDLGDGSDFVYLPHTDEKSWEFIRYLDEHIPWIRPATFHVLGNSNVFLQHWLEAEKKMIIFSAQGISFIYISLLMLIRLKFPHGESFVDTATGTSFLILSLVSLFIAIATLTFLLSPDEPFKSTNASLMRHVTLKFGFFFSALVAVISLVIVLFLPHKLHWVGYVVICVIFVLAVAYYLCLYRGLRKKKDLSSPADDMV